MTPARAAASTGGHAFRYSVVHLSGFWEYQPSEIVVVCTDERDTTLAGYPGLRNKAFVVKVNRLFRY
jgi:hypothetical protein